MDVYKGTGAFSGIAIGKILYYHKSEYQIIKKGIYVLPMAKGCFPSFIIILMTMDIHGLKK